LIGSPEFIEHWTNKWADMLQVNRKFLGEQGAAALRGWIRQAVASNMPYDQFAYTVLTADGSTLENPPASYYKVLRTPADRMENTTQLFLAVRFNCNKCHDHPFEKWTQNQYYELSAYFTQVARKEDPKFRGRKTEGTAVRGPLPLVEIIEDKKDGEIKNERTGQNAVAHFPLIHPGTPKAEGSLQLGIYYLAVQECEELEPYRPVRAVELAHGKISGSRSPAQSRRADEKDEKPASFTPLAVCLINC